MLSTVLVGVSAIIILTLGVAHLVYTFHGPKLLPRDRETLSAMKATSPEISNETTMWRAWLGFNASHSIGAMLFGLMFGYLSFSHPDLLFGSMFLTGLGLATLCAYLVLGKRYWFSIPFTGIAIALICFVSGVAAWWL